MHQKEHIHGLQAAAGLQWAGVMCIVLAATDQVYTAIPVQQVHQLDVKLIAAVATRQHVHACISAAVRRLAGTCPCIARWHVTRTHAGMHWYAVHARCGNSQGKGVPTRPVALLRVPAEHGSRCGGLLLGVISRHGQHLAPDAGLDAGGVLLVHAVAEAAVIGVLCLRDDVRNVGVALRHTQRGKVPRCSAKPLSSMALPL